MRSPRGRGGRLLFDTIPIHVWPITRALAGETGPALFEGLCQRLADTTLALARARLSVALLHPAWRGYSLTWRRNRNAMEDEVLRRMAETGEQIGKDWVQSPFEHLLENRLRTMRRRLTGPEALIDFPLLAEFRDRGLTDWIAYVHGFGGVADLDWTDEVGMVSSWATDAPEGFADDDIDSLHELASTFALAGLISPREIFTLG